MAKKQPEIKTDADAAKYARNDALEEAALKLEEHAKAIVAAGDQFDQGGDIYCLHRPTMQAAQIVRALKVAT